MAEPILRRYPNKEGITQFTFELPACGKCTIGGNFRTSIVKGYLELGDYYCDLEDLQRYIEKDLNGGTYTEEELAGKVFDTLKEAYEPKHMKIIIYSTLHFPTEVIKEM